MALYTNTKGWINKVELKSSKKGQNYAVVNICIQSKRKDEKGEYTINEDHCYIYATVFSKKALGLLAECDFEKGLFCKLNLKLESAKKDDNYYQNWTLLSFDNIAINRAPNSTETEENTATYSEESIDANATLSDEEQRELAIQILKEQGITVNLPTDMK